MKSNRKQMGKEKDKVVFPLAESLSAMPSDYLFCVFPGQYDLQPFLGNRCGRLPSFKEII